MLTPERRAYNNAKCRCECVNTPYYKNYGGRGIKFLFKNYEQFFKAVGLRPSAKRMLDRIENDGHYKPGNVRWATRSEQNRNQRPWTSERRMLQSAAAKKRCTPAWRAAVSKRVKRQYRAGKFGKSTWGDDTRRAAYVKIGNALRGRSSCRKGAKATPEQREHYRQAALKREAAKRKSRGD